MKKKDLTRRGTRCLSYQLTTFNYRQRSNGKSKCCSFIYNFTVLAHNDCTCLTCRNCIILRQLSKMILLRAVSASHIFIMALWRLHNYKLGFCTALNIYGIKKERAAKKNTNVVFKGWLAKVAEITIEKTTSPNRLKAIRILRFFTTILKKLIILTNAINHITKY